VITAIILAGGNSLRFGGDTPKQFTEIAGRSLLDFSVSTFSATPTIDNVIIVVPIQFKEALKKKYPNHKIIVGGKTRKDSSYNGLLACSTDTKKVLIHDAARIFITQNLIENCILGLTNADAVTLAIPVVDTIALQSNNIITKMDERLSMIAIQTPQGFDYSKICFAHKNYKGDATDDMRLMFNLGYKCVVIHGHEDNYKITTMRDFEKSQTIIKE
jgi:2-C-methyl-D-erythritol 4-phosphate cytidylyltransferase